MDSCIAFAGDANALAVARARLHAHLQRLCALHCAFAVAYRARRLHLARAAAARAGNVEFHPAAGLRNVAAPPRPPPPKMLERMSRNPPPPPDRPPAPPRSEKSKPLKSKPWPPRSP